MDNNDSLFTKAELRKIKRVVFLTGAAALVVGGVAMYMKLDGIARKLDTSIVELSRKSKLDVDASIVEKAVQLSVDREVGYMVTSAANAIVRDTSADMRVKVDRAVNSVYKDVTDAVSKEVAKRVANLDMGALTAEVRTEAKEAILEKFDGNLDTILQDFNSNLTNVSKIYESIAGTVAKKPEKEMVFKIG